MVVRFFVPFFINARIRFSGMPHRPKPPIMMEAPSSISRMASSADVTTFFIAQPSRAVTHQLSEQHLSHGPRTEA